MSALSDVPTASAEHPGETTGHRQARTSRHEPILSTTAINVPQPRASDSGLQRAIVASERWNYGRSVSCRQTQTSAFAPRDVTGLPPGGLQHAETTPIFALLAVQHCHDAESACFDNQVRDSLASLRFAPLRLSLPCALRRLLASA